MTAELSPDVERFEVHRPLLLGVAYRMLGSITDAEDVVQDAYLRFSTVPAGQVLDDRSLLVTIVTRLCLDILKSARRQREQYIGQWLPEPVATAWSRQEASPEQRVDLRESISLAFLLLLERLSPLERAAFLLHDVFDYDHAEVATILSRTSDAARQLAHRARRHLAEARPRFVARRDQHEQLTNRFLGAVVAGDTSVLLTLLAEDAAATSDGGGKVASARRVVHGADRVARFVVGVARKEQPASIVLSEVNGVPAVVANRRGRPFMAVVLGIADGRVSDVFIVRNPEKLTHLAEPVLLA